jgi:hypothetical protein
VMHEAIAERGPVPQWSSSTVAQERHRDQAVANQVRGASRPRAIELARFGETRGRWALDRAGTNREAMGIARPVVAGLDGIRILLLPAGAVEPAQEALAGFVERLRRTPEMKLVDTQGEAGLELVARARATTGLAGLDDRAARARLLDLLHESGAADAVVWYALDPSGRFVDHCVLLADTDHSQLATALDLLWIADRVDAPAPRATEAHVRVRVGG